MKHYNINNYIRYKNDVDDSIKRIPHKEFNEYTRNELVTTLLPLVENLARKFATSQQASGVMSINDLIQEGNLNLCKAIRRIDWTRLSESEDQEKTLKSFLSIAISFIKLYLGKRSSDSESLITPLVSISFTL